MQKPMFERFVTACEEAEDGPRALSFVTEGSNELTVRLAPPRWLWVLSCGRYAHFSTSVEVRGSTVYSSFEMFA